MQQVFVIHGGDAFASYEDYLADLEVKQVRLAGMKMLGWKRTLGMRLGEDFEVFNPTMPNAQNAKYAEWKMWFDKIVPFMEDGVILVGHSLGGIFLAKYLAEEKMTKRIRATFLVAAPFNTPTEHPLADFILSADLSGLREQAGEVFLYHSKDDVVVPYSNALSYQAALPDAHLATFDNRGHFNDETFPELEKDIQSLL